MAVTLSVALTVFVLLATPFVVGTLGAVLLGVVRVDVVVGLLIGDIFLAVIAELVLVIVVAILLIGLCSKKKKITKRKKKKKRHHKPSIDRLGNYNTNVKVKLCYLFDGSSRSGARHSFHWR